MGTVVYILYVYGDQTRDLLAPTAHECGPDIKGGRPDVGSDFQYSGRSKGTNKVEKRSSVSWVHAAGLAVFNPAQLGESWRIGSPLLPDIRGIEDAPYVIEHQ
jgi:hypothetical protein